MKQTHIPSTLPILLAGAEPRNGGADKDQRRATERIRDSKKIHRALDKAFTRVDGLSEVDAKRIASLLPEHSGEFKHLAHFAAFQAAIVTWATRQAQLSVTLREALPQVMAVLTAEGVFFDNTAHISALLFDRLPRYTGNVDCSEVVTWATADAIEIARKMVGVWQRYAKAERAVYMGIRKILNLCRDFDTAIGMQLVADNLAFGVMLNFVHHSYEFSSDDQILAKQLARRGSNAAHAWKKATLAKLSKWEVGKPVESLGPEQAEVFQMKVTSGRDQVISKSRPLTLGPNDTGQQEALSRGALRLEPYDVPLGYLEPHYVSTSTELRAAA